jgi:hypothetical protein
MRVVAAICAALAVVATAMPTAAAPPVSIGVELGVVSRDIEEEGGLGGLSFGTAEGIADSVRLTARLSLGLAPGVAIFGEVGGADLAVDEFEGYRSDMHLSYGGGLRLSSVTSGYPGQPVVYADFRVSRLATNDQLLLDWCDDLACATATTRPSKEDLEWTEYAVGLGIRGALQGLRPFGGLQFSKLDGTDTARTLDGTQREARAEVREANPVGFFLGADIPLDRSGQSEITIKLSGIDENAFRVGYKVVF